MVVYRSPQKKQWINQVNNSLKPNNSHIAILNQRIKKNNIYKVVNINMPKAKR